MLMKEQPRRKVRHFRYSNFKYKMEKRQIWQKLVHEKVYVHEITAVNLSKICLLKNFEHSKGH